MTIDNETLKTALQQVVNDINKENSKTVEGLKKELEELRNDNKNIREKYSNIIPSQGASAAKPIDISPSDPKYIDTVLNNILGG